MRLLENKIALVTGGSRGIGEAIVRKFAQEGAHVAFTYHSSAERAEMSRQKRKSSAAVGSCSAT